MLIRRTTSLTEPRNEEQPEGFAIWLMRGVFRLDQHVQDFELRISEIEARLGLLPRAKARDLGYEADEDDLF
jgi:hypothetical protein